MITAGREGWITQLHRNLEVRLAQIAGEAEVIKLRAAQLTIRIDLHMALGGGFGSGTDSE